MEDFYEKKIRKLQLQLAFGIKEGYGQKKYLDKQHPEWNIVEEGIWKEGVFQSGILRYEYKKSVQ